MPDSYTGMGTVICLGVMVMTGLQIKEEKTMKGSPSKLERAKTMVSANSPKKYPFCINIIREATDDICGRNL